MKRFHTESLDNLEKGIKQLLKENRCLFSEKETKLLKDCILALNALKKEQDLTLFVTFVDLLLKLLSVSEQIRNWF